VLAVPACCRRKHCSACLPAFLKDEIAHLFVRACVYGHSDLQVGLVDAKVEKSSAGKRRDAVLVEVLFGAQTSRSATGCENTEMQLVPGILVMCAHFQANYVRQIWCTI
jgi:hypothetical protein